MPIKNILVSRTLRMYKLTVKITWKKAGEKSGRKENVSNSS